MIAAQALIEKFRYALDNNWGYIWGTAGIEWNKAQQNKKVNYMVSKYGTGWKNNSEAKNDKYYGAAVHGSKWIGHMVSDCSGMFVWAYKQLGGPGIAHGSNSIWRSYCSVKGKLSGGKRTDGQGLKPGSAVFVYKKDKDNRSHIGLYVGNGIVIEASGTIVGVITSKVSDKKWAEWGELKAVDYSGEVPEETTPDDDQGFPDKPGWRATIRRGSKGQEVIECQTMLYRLGYDIGVSGIDGDYGRNTEKAVKAFQTDHRLTVDGVCGPMTWDALDKAIAQQEAGPKEKQYTVCIHHLDKTQMESMRTNYPGCVVTEE